MQTITINLKTKTVLYTSRILILLCILSISINSYSQDIQKEVSIDMKRKSIEFFLKELSKKANIHFSYSSNLEGLNKKITYKAANKSVNEILDDVLVHQEIEYKFVEKQIVLYRSTETKKDDKDKYTISGTVRNKNSGEYIIGTNVYTKDLHSGTTTNEYGFYSFTLPSGNYNIVFSFIGYKQYEVSLDLTNDTLINTDLHEIILKIPEIVVKANDNPVQLRQLSQMKFTPKILGSLPAFAGDVDIIKSLNTVPGISSYGDGSTMFYVRGGDSDQNLVMIDDAPVFNPTHLFGFFSALAPDAIKNVEIYKGDFPARFGNRLSSVIDIRSKDGNMRHFGFGGNLGPYTSSLSFEGPILRDKISYFFSARRSNLNWLGEIAGINEMFDFKFYDLHAKLNYQLNNKNRFYITFYKGQDDYSRIGNGKGVFGISWDNALATLRWNYIISNRIFINTTLLYSKYNYFMYINRETNDYWLSSIENMGIKTDLTYFINPNNTFRLGFLLENYYSEPGNIHFSDSETQKSAPSIPSYNSLETVLYASHEIQITDRLSGRFGLRISIWQDYGPTEVHYYDEYHRYTHTLEIPDKDVYKTFINAEPRMNLIYLLGRSASLKASYTRAVQYLQLLSNSSSPFTSLDVWVPSGPNIAPTKADQYAIGYFQNLIGQKLVFSAEAYYKDFQNEIDYKDHAKLLSNPLIEGELRFGKAWSYGIEFLLRKDHGKFNGWIAYTYSRAFKKIKDVNDGKTFPSFYDRPHNFNISIAWQPTFRWSFSANWFYISGAAITTPVGFYYSNGYQVPIYDEKHNDRLPDYKRLDFSVKLHFGKPEHDFQHSISFTLYNALGNKNPFAVNFNKEINNEDEFKVPVNFYEGAELVSTTLSVSGMVPSINYKFRFR